MEKEYKYFYKFRYGYIIDEKKRLTINELIALGEPQHIQIMLPGGEWIWLDKYLLTLKND